MSRIDYGTFALVLAAGACLITPSGANAQVFGDRQQVECGTLTEGDVIDSSIEIVCGMSAAEFADNMRLALSPLATDKQELFRRLDDLLPDSARLRVEAIRGFFQTLGEAGVPPESLADRFAQIATRHFELLEEIRRFRVQDPEVQALKDQATIALEADPPDHDLASAKLESARGLVREKRQAAAKLFADQQREEAQLVRERAAIEETRLRFAAAARFYEEAASLLPPDDEYQRWSDLVYAGLRWTDQGRDFGDNSALIEAIRVYGQALEEKTRERVPLDWAMTQNNLGDALWTLGQRESDTKRLEEAVEAFKASLEEQTRERVPLDWAMTQNNLGIALSILGQRESGTGRLEQSVEAFQAALEEYTRERVPLDWAMTQNNLGGALQILGERTGRSETLAAALEAVRNAYEVFVKEAGQLHYEADFLERIQALEAALETAEAGG
ncbi:MAG: hypothetical protein ACFB6S_14545 [Geminicoccaceae bacterium]